MFALEGILACGKTDRKKSKFFQIIISKSTRKLFKAVVIITNPAQNTSAGLDNKSNFQLKIGLVVHPLPGGIMMSHHGSYSLQIQ